MYFDENGHQSLKGDLSNQSKRFLCLTGVIMRLSEHPKLTEQLNRIKKEIFGRTDIILHRRELITAKAPYEALKDTAIREKFNQEFLKLIVNTNFRIVSVLIDKMTLVKNFGFRAQDPYALALEYLMQRYLYWLQDLCRCKPPCFGDILGESRGGKEDKITKYTHREIFLGKGYNKLSNVDRYFSSQEIKLKPKKANIAGLQFVDLLAHPARRYILSKYNLAENLKQSSYEQQIADILENSKFRRRNGTIEGTGIVIFPNPKKDRLA